MVRVGQLNSMVVKGENGEVISGSMSQVIMLCTVTDNRVGRLSMTSKGKTGFRFITVADATGFISLGMNAAETSLRDHDKEESDCGENSRLFLARKSLVT